MSTLASISTGSVSSSSSAPAPSPSSSSSTCTSSSTSTAAGGGPIYLRRSAAGRRLCKTLLVYLQALVGHITKVELKNELIVRGKIEQVDSVGNLFLTDLTMPTSNSSPSSHFSHMFIRAKQIRFVHIPDRLDVFEILHRHESNLDRPLLKYRRMKRTAPKENAQTRNVLPRLQAK